VNAVKIRKGTFKHVESELFAYHDTRKEIIRLRNEILYSSTPPDTNGGGKSNLPGDPTASKVSALTTNKRLEHLTSIADAIERTYERLPEEKKRLVNLYYWTKPQTLTWEGISLKLNVSRRWAIHWRDEVVYAIADKIGWR
jgi:RinA family phage transcriptional activator